eukprot:gene29273-38785_t
MSSLSEISTVSSSILSSGNVQLSLINVEQTVPQCPEEEINSHYVEKYSIVLHYPARIDKNGSTGYIVWTANIMYISKPADFPYFILGLEVLWRNVSAYFYLPEEMEDAEEDDYIFDVETREKLFLVMQDSVCTDLFSVPNVMFITPSCRGNKVAIQVGVLGKGMIPICAATNEPLHIPKEITVKDLGTFQVEVCEGWTEQCQFSVQCGQDIASKMKPLRIGTLGGALQLKGGTSMERFVTTCEHVINAEDTISSRNPTSLKLRLLVYLGFRNHVLVDNVSQDPPDYKNLLDFAMKLKKPVDVRDAMYKVREDLRITPIPDGAITWKEFNDFTNSVDIGEYRSGDQLPNRNTIVVRGVPCEVSSDVSVIRLNGAHAVMNDSCNTFDVCVDANLIGSYQPKRFMNLSEIVDVFSKSEIRVSMSGVTRVDETTSRSGVVTAPIHLRQLHSLPLKNRPEPILFNQVLVSSDVPFGFKGDSGAWVLAHYEGNCDVLGVFVGKVCKTANSGFLYYVSTVAHLEE